MNTLALAFCLFAQSDFSSSVSDELMPLPRGVGPARRIASEPSNSGITGSETTAAPSRPPVYSSTDNLPFKRPAAIEPAAPSTPVGGTRSVAPASFSQQERQRDPAAVLAELCVGGTDGSPNERSVRLLDLVRAALPAGDPLRSVQSYWKLAGATGRYHFALQEERALQQLQRARGGYDDPLLVAEAAAASARVQQTLLELVEERNSLSGVIGSGQPDEVIWPADPPLVGNYETRFETLFGSGQVVPLRLKQIDRVLPHLQSLVGLQADAVSAFSNARDQLRPESDLARWLEMHRQLRHHRRAFLSAVVSYNLQIAEYSFAVTSPGTPAATLVATLIPTKPERALVAVTPQSRSTAGQETSRGAAPVPGRLRR